MTAGRDREPLAQVGQWVIVAATSGTVLIGLGAFWLSFTALADLARRSGIAPELSWLWPLIVDGVIVVATISVVALSRYGAGATRYAWTLLVGGAAVSVSANVTHATVAASAEVPGAVAAMVASVPPIVLLAITHLTVVLTRYRQGPRAPAASLRPIGDADDGFTQLSAASKALERPSARPPRVQADQRHGLPAKARVLRTQGLSNRRIASDLGVHPSTVGRWLGALTEEPVEAGVPGWGRAIDEGDDDGAAPVRRRRGEQAPGAGSG
ncbi:DUF2637 domain-containing protein [Microbacterium rhizophilus]|uniref:DUF2637 domain-containing protein n=1 Tax=Microbacterium rhizophilus TaxID=3138934 RepID=UPI0031E68699